jgi:hypothetical protein
MATHYDESETNKHEMDEIIETLASKLYFHGHPINRKEAREELKLKVMRNVPPELEALLWKLYLDFEVELENKVPFDPMATIYASAPAPVIQQGQMSIIPPGSFAEFDQKMAFIESERLSTVFSMKRRFVVANFDQQGAPQVRAEVLNQGWTPSPVPEPPPSA